MLLCAVLAAGYSFGQNNPAKKITIHSENNQVIDATTEPPIQYLNGDVKLFHSNAFMYCDTAILSGPLLKMYHNVVLLQNDTIRIFADSARYNGDSLVAYIYGNIILENGPSRKLYTTFLRYDLKNKTGYYTRNARLVDGKSTLISKRGTYRLNEKTAWFYENVKVDGEDFDMVSDSLSYHTVTQEVKFLAPVLIHRDSADIYSLRGWFDLDDKIGDFIGEAQYSEDKTRASADTISYNGKTEMVVLKSAGKSFYVSEKDTATARIITYDQKNEVYTLKHQAWYKGESSEVTGDDVYYDKKSEKFLVKGRSRVSDPPSIIEADNLDYSKSAKNGKADGNVVWQDTSARTTIMADHVMYRGQDNFMKAYNDKGRPLFISEVDSDSLFMRADTLRSFRSVRERIILPDARASRKAKKDKPDTSSPDREARDSVAVLQDIIPDVKADTVFTGIMDTFDFFGGLHDVRIFKSDMQAVCDSLVYSKTDSVFTLFKAPFVWSDSSQIAGDTIDIFMKNKKMDKLTVRQQAIILSSEDLIFFNQIKGRFLEAGFRDGKIYRMDVVGDAQVVYYLYDKEKGYSGVNTTEASNMTFNLDENKVTDIHNYREPRSKVLPMKTTDHESIKVKGFKWNILVRPKSSDDL